MGAAAKQSEFYLVINDEKFGPVTREDVLSQLKEGKITTSDLIWTEGYKDWIEIGNVGEFSFRSKKPSAKPPKNAGPIQNKKPQPTSKVKVFILVVVFALNALWIGPAINRYLDGESFWATKPTDKPPPVRPSASIEPDRVVAELMSKDFGSLGKLSTLLERVAGGGGSIKWTAQGEDRIVTITKPHSQHSVKFARVKDSSANEIHMETSTITVNSSDCPHEFFSEVALCFGLIAREP
jgi:hypothetical protein